MYVCVYIYIYTHVYMYVYIYIYIYLYIMCSAYGIVRHRRTLNRRAPSVRGSARLFPRGAMRMLRPFLPAGRVCVYIYTYIDRQIYTLYIITYIYIYIYPKGIRRARPARHLSKGREGLPLWSGPGSQSIIYIYVYMYMSLSLSIYIYIYTYVYKGSCAIYYLVVRSSSDGCYNTPLNNTAQLKTTQQHTARHITPYHNTTQHAMPYHIV